MRSKSRKLALTMALGLAIAGFAPSTAASHGLHSCPWSIYCVRFSWIQGFNDPATPDNLDRVGVLKIGSPFARNILVLSPGTSAGSGYFKPLADDIVNRTHGRWQVWSVERRENQLEDHSVLNKFKQGQANSQQLFDYYLGWLNNPSITNHFQLIPDASVAFGRGWGMNVEIEDLHRVVEAAHRFGRTVALGGHSLGGSITTAYATWDFNGKAGAKDLSGLVYIDGGSNPVPVTPQQATQSLQTLQTSTPWLAFGGIPSPFLGLFSAAGSCGTVYDPNGPSLGYSFPLLPANLKPPLPAGVVPTNEAQFGYAVSVPSSPSNLIAAQVHAGHIADSGNPRGWVRAGAITPIQRYAAMLCGKGLTGLDGNAWYHPMRLTIDSGAVADGNANPAQSVLNVKAIHGDDLGKHTPIYAFGAALGGEGVLATARILAQQSGIPDSKLTLINRQSTYSHNDPSAASPNNEFLDNLIPFLGKVGKPHFLHFPH
ncbi:MAG: alpha/beta hydrolase [Chloroflexota bacterium]|nr:alpha/beta hydrolase [Chloroflexota bacterium]